MCLVACLRSCACVHKRTCLQTQACVHARSRRLDVFGCMSAFMRMRAQTHMSSNAGLCTRTHGCSYKTFFAIGVHLPICAHTPAHACTDANVFAARPGREDTDDTNCLTVQTATLDSRVAGSIPTPRLYDDIGRQDDENATPDARSSIMAILSRQNAHLKRSCVRGDDIGG